MAYEFQRLDAVTEVTEVSDSATVLIEEDGEIKRAPKGLVGGGFDTVLTIHPDGDDGQTVEFEGKSVEEIIEMIENGKAPTIAILGKEDGGPDWIIYADSAGEDWDYSGELYIRSNAADLNGRWTADNKWYFD